MRTPRALAPGHAALVAFGAVVLGHALQIRDGFYDPVALSWVVLAAVLVITGVGRIIPEGGSESVVAGVLTAGLLSNVLALATMPIGMYLAHPEPWRHPEYLAGLAVAMLCMLLIAFDARRGRSAW